MFLPVLAIALAIVVGALWWDRRSGRAPGAAALAAAAGTIACVWMAWLLIDEFKAATLAAPGTTQLLLAGALPGAIFAASVVVASGLRWQRWNWLAFVLPIPVAAAFWIMSSDGGNAAWAALAWAMVAWSAGATPSAAKAAKTTGQRWLVGIGAAPVAAVMVWAILLFPVLLLTGFTDDFERPPPTLSFEVDVAAEGPFSIRLAWANATLDGPAWTALQHGLGAAWEADGRAVWFNGTGTQQWQARLLAYPYYEDDAGLDALGNLTATGEGSVSFRILLRPGGGYESLSGSATVSGSMTIPTQIDRFCT